MNINMSMYEFVMSHRDHTEVDAMIYYGTHISSSTMYDDIYDLAYYLSHVGVGKGDSVAICLPNFPQAIISFYATNYIGAVANIIHPLVPPLGLKAILAQIETRVIFIYDVFYKKYKSVLDSLDILVVICSAGEYMKGVMYGAMRLYSKALAIKQSEKLVRYNNVFKQDYTAIAAVKDDGDADACYLHSGGTTGQPKTVVMTNRALNSCGHNINNLIGHELEVGDSMLMVLPLFHVFGLGVCMHSALSSNATSVLVPQFNARKVCKIVAKHQLTYLCGVPSMYSKMMDCKEFGGAHLKKLKYCYSGGDKLKKDIIDKFNDIAAQYGADCHLCEGYGLTEATICTVNATSNSRDGSVGYGIGDCHIKIVGEDNIELPYGDIGEIAVGGTSVMDRYYGDESTTAQVIFTADNMRYIRTGDIGRMDESRHLYFIDRRKRMMKVSGINVFPSEIEAVVYESIKEVAHCVAFESKLDGKSCVKLYLVLKDKIVLSGELIARVQAEVASRLMKYSVPRIIEQKESLPLTHIGKVDYKSIVGSETAFANKE